MTVRAAAIENRFLIRLIYLFGDHFASFFDQLSHTYINEYPEHDAADDALIVPSTARGNPSNLIAVQNAEISFVCPDNLACRRK